MKNDELLITKLIEETCNEEATAPETVTTTNTNVHDLSSYFERKVNQVEFLSLKKYLSQQALHSLSMSFNENNKCFRVEMGECILDFPSNWSVFEKITQDNVAYINKENDQDFLCDIFSEIERTCESFILINDEGNYNLVTFSDYSGKVHYDWVNEYFEKKKEKDTIKAA